MSFLTKKVTWANWQFGPLKLSMVTLGIILGVYFTAFCQSILWLVWVVFVVTAIWASIIWFQSMKRS